MQKKQSAVSSQRSAVGTTRRVVRPRPPVVAAVAVPVPQTRDQHLSALSAKIDATHKALVTVATGIVNLKRKLRRQE